MPVELLPDDEVVILLEPVVLETLLRTVTHLPPGTSLELRGQSSLDSDMVLATSVHAVITETPDHMSGSYALVEGLSVAERRVLAYLRTHLTLAEIGARLFVSRNTVKSQAISIYRKLGVTARDQAVAAARRLGLIA